MERKHIIKEIFNMAKRDFTLTFSLAIILILIIFSIFPQYIAKYDFYDVDLSLRLNPPSLDYPFGTDFLGRDILSMIIWGSRIALIITIWPTLISATIGVAIGILSGYVGGVFDDIVMRGVDILMSFPSLLLALGIISVLGPGITNAMIAVTIGRISSYVRLSRSLTFSVKETGFVEYAKALGASRTRIMLRYIFPNVLTPIIVQITFSMPGTLLNVASLSFLGLGGKPPTPDWGVLMQQSRIYLLYAPWAAIIPGIAIFLVAFSFNTIGEALRDIVDPRRKYIRMV
jgi:ABC-type dipeptide/oligopeptide/nickel transport system permease subunit